MYAWSMLDISWLASRVGNFLCMDESIEKLDRLEYAKCVVDVSPDHALPEEFAAQMVDGTVHYVRVSYLWKPLICSECNVFGHEKIGCDIRGKEKVCDKKRDNNLVAASVDKPKENGLCKTDKMEQKEKDLLL